MSVDAPSNGPQKPVFNADRALPLSPHFATEPPSDLRYHRFQDNEGNDHEIFVPPGREQEILDLTEQKNWTALLEFPPFSDCPPVLDVRAYCLGIVQDDGSYKYYFIPQDDDKQDRMSELMIAKDYETVDKEFEPWKNQPHGLEQKMQDWKRGVECLAYARAEAAGKSVTGQAMTGNN